MKEKIREWLYASWAVFRLSFFTLLRTRRSLFLFILAWSQVGLAVIWLISWYYGKVGTGVNGLGVFSIMMVTSFLQFLVLITVLFYGSSLIGDEVEGRTLAYLLVRPLPKSSIISGKFLALILGSSLIIYPAVIACYALLLAPYGLAGVFRNLPTLFTDLWVILLAFFAYGAVFAFLGVGTKRPVLIGLLFAFGWESIVTYIPGQVNKLTLMHYIQSLFPHHVFRGDLTDFLAIFREPAGRGTSLLVLLGVGLTFLFFSSFVLANKEYYLEQ
jgi:ABC-2 type transport system permease protein